MFMFTLYIYSVLYWFALSLVPRSPQPRNETSFYHGHCWFILVLGSLWDVGMKCARTTWLAA